MNNSSPQNIIQEQQILFCPFLTQRYFLTSEDMENFAQVERTYFVILLLCFSSFLSHKASVPFIVIALKIMTI